jgi:hypothetical protein
MAGFAALARDLPLLFWAHCSKAAFRPAARAPAALCRRHASSPFPGFNGEVAPPKRPFSRTVHNPDLEQFIADFRHSRRQNCCKNVSGKGNQRQIVAHLELCCAK